MSRIELIYDKDCPNVEQARQNLREALRRADLPNTWQELDRNDPASPGYANYFGSPTILIDGEDLAGIAGKVGNNCRIYPDENGGFRGSPSVENIVKSLQNHSPKKWTRAGGLLPVLGVALLPKLTCPACWPAYAWLLGVMGLDFINYTPWLLPMMSVLLVPALGVLAFRAERRRGYGPFVLGLTGSAFLLAGKFYFNLPFVEYAGMAGLITAFVWNAWPKKPDRVETDCPACGDTEKIYGKVQ